MTIFDGSGEKVALARTRAPTHTNTYARTHTHTPCNNKTRSTVFSFNAPASVAAPSGPNALSDEATTTTRNNSGCEKGVGNKLRTSNPGKKGKLRFPENAQIVPKRFCSLKMPVAINETRGGTVSDLTFNKMARSQIRLCFRPPEMSRPNG